MHRESSRYFREVELQIFSMETRRDCELALF